MCNLTFGIAIYHISQDLYVSTVRESHSGEGCSVKITAMLRDTDYNRGHSDDRLSLGFCLQSHSSREEAIARKFHCSLRVKHTYQSIVIMWCNQFHANTKRVKNTGLAILCPRTPANAKDALRGDIIVRAWAVDSFSLPEANPVIEANCGWQWKPITNDGTGNQVPPSAPYPGTFSKEKQRNEEKDQ
jgi:hypothetical protein